MMLRSFKLRFFDEHVRVLPKTDAQGCPFSGAGVDLRGEAAQEAFRRARGLYEALEAVEPKIVIRSLSLDLEKPRLLVSLEPRTGSGDTRPQAVRIEEGVLLRQMLEKSKPLVEYLTTAAREALAAREAEQGRR